MKTNRYLTFFAALLLAGSVSAKNDSATDYEIKLVREESVGSRCRVSASGTTDEQFEASVAGQNVQAKSEKFSVEIIAVCEKLAMSTLEHGAKNKLILEKAIMTQNGQTVTLLESGTEVIQERVSGETRFSVRGEPVAVKVAKAFEAAGFSMSDFGNANDDDIFGTKARKKVGDSWSINATAAATDFSKMVFQVKPENFAGSTALKEVITVGNQKCLVIAGSMAIRSIFPPAPDGMEVQSCEANGVFSGIFPVDVAKPRLQESGSLEMKVVFSGTQAGQKTLVRVSNKTSHTQKYSAL